MSDQKFLERMDDKDKNQRIELAIGLRVRDDMTHSFYVPSIHGAMMVALTELNGIRVTNTIQISLSTLLWLIFEQ